MGVRELADRYWRGLCENGPLLACGVGSWDFPGLGDLSPAGHESRRSGSEALLIELAGLPQALPGEELTRRELRAILERDLASADARTDDWCWSQLFGPHLTLLGLGRLHPREVPEAREGLVERVQGAGVYLEGFRASLEAGLARGRTPPRRPLGRVLSQLESLLAQSPGDWDLARHLEGESEDESLREAVVEVLAPALDGLRGFLRERLMPVAREGAQAGLGALPGGDADYARLIRVQTTLSIEPGELHQRGLDLLEYLREEAEARVQEALGVRDLTRARRLLEEDPRYDFASPGEPVALAAAALERAEAYLSRWLPDPPRDPCRVEAIPSHAAPGSSVAYYSPPDREGRRPGVFFVNCDPGARMPRPDLEAVAFHEALPGHHLQSVRAWACEDLPEFRRQCWIPAYGEGWALYAEALAEEAGLYSDSLALLGRTSQSLWRAARLVVDTGLHARGWSPEQAESFFREHTLVPENLLASEVDRYLVQPAQALSYQVGASHLAGLRERAEARLGEDFDLRRFHSRVLDAGLLSLETLEERIEGWLGEENP